MFGFNRVLFTPQPKVKRSIKGCGRFVWFPPQTQVCHQSKHSPKTFDVSEIGGIILLVAEAKADAKAKAADTKPTEYEKAVTGKK